MSATKSDVLVGRDWLVEHLDDPELVILEVAERMAVPRQFPAVAVDDL